MSPSQEKPAVLFMHRFASRPLLIILLTIAGLFVAVHSLPVVRAQPGLPVVGVWSSAYGSSNVTDMSLIVGSSVTFDVNVTGAPDFNGYEFSLYYDPGFLKVQSVDFTTGTVFNSPFIGKNDLSQPGTIYIAVVNLGSAFTGGTGTLLHITFQVTNVGVSPMTLAQGIASPGRGGQSLTRLVLGLATIDVTTTDGYFKNDPSRQGPVASFDFTPASPLLGETVIFDSSASFDPDNNTGASRGIVLYSWDFGDGFSYGTFFPVIVHRFGQAQIPGLSGNFSVRLTVLDSNDGFTGMITRRVAVSPTPPESTNFQLSTFGAPLSFVAGGNSRTSVSLQSIGGFQGNVSLTAHISPAILNGPTVSIAEIILQVPSGGLSQTLVTVNTTSDTPPGNYGIIVTGTSGVLSHSDVTPLTILRSPFFPQISARNYFTSEDGDPLPVDATGSPSVNVVISHGILRATDPDRVFAWMNLTNTGTISLSSLRSEETLPTNWILAPMTRHSHRQIHVFFQFSNRTLLDITRTATIVVSGINPETISLKLANITGTRAGKTLDPGESILVSVKLNYLLIGTRESPRFFPILYEMASQALSWTMTSFRGTMSSSLAAAFFSADPKAKGDVDLSLVAFSFTTTAGDPKWSPAANLGGSLSILETRTRERF